MIRTGRERLFGMILSVGLACAMPVAAAAAAPVLAAEGQHDFDFEIGTWATQARVLRNPLSGNTPNWADYQGTSLVRPIMGGRANVVELSIGGAAGRIEGISLRLYNPQVRQWSLNYVNLHDGLLTSAVYGGFDGSGHGVFYGHDMLDGRAILVRFLITQVSSAEAHFEQAFSADGGATWEVNWIATDKKVAA